MYGRGGLCLRHSRRAFLNYEHREVRSRLRSERMKQQPGLALTLVELVNHEL